jgi:hypothetical protein
MKGFGGNFTADDKDFDPVLREIASRGLFYLETATSTVAGTQAGDQRQRCAAGASLPHCRSQKQLSGFETARSNGVLQRRDEGGRACAPVTRLGRWPFARSPGIRRAVL